MFVQIIQGRTSDAEGLKRQLERWRTEIRPSAIGFLGSTGGVAADGTAILLARFADEASAQSNGARAEQSAWWNETEKYFDGKVTFTESSDIDTYRLGGSDAAGFVQIMQGRTSDRDRLQQIADEMLDRLEVDRPDVLGMTTIWQPDGRYTQAVYFASEAAAREGEQKAPPEDLIEGFAEWERLMGDVTYIDLTAPMLAS